MRAILPRTFRWVARCLDSAIRENPGNRSDGPKLTSAKIQLENLLFFSAIEYVGVGEFEVCGRRRVGVGARSGVDRRRWSRVRAEVG